MGQSKAPKFGVQMESDLWVESKSFSVMPSGRKSRWTMWTSENGAEVQLLNRFCSTELERTLTELNKTEQNWKNQIVELKNLAQDV